MKRDYPYIWTDGIVRGFVGGIPTPEAPLVKQILGAYEAEGKVSYIGAYLEKCLLRVTTNGKVWSYAVSPMVVAYTIDTPGAHLGKRSFNIRFAHNYLPERTVHNRIRALSVLTSEYRGAVEWARKDLAKRTKLPATDPGALQLDVAYDIEAPQDAGSVKLPGPFGPITYTGFGKKVGHYTLEQIHEICAKGAADVSAIWTWRSVPDVPWKPTHLEIMLHSGRSALGLAYAPGTGPHRCKRTISLNKTLFELYDPLATWRVLVHELCHHYRDEVFDKNEVEPQEQAALLQAVKAYRESRKFSGNYKWWQNVLSTHDSVFVRELGRVDPKIKESAISGILFTEYADPSLVAEVKAKKVARAAKAKIVLFDPTQGRLYVDRTKTHFSLWWIPLTEGAWRPHRMNMNNWNMNSLITQLGGGWRQTRVTYSDTYYSYWSKPESLDQFAQLMEHNMGFSISALRHET